MCVHTFALVYAGTCWGAGAHRGQRYPEVQAIVNFSTLLLGGEL